MANPHYYVPAGLPPGEGPQGIQEGPPEAVYYYRIYGGTVAALCTLLIAAGIGSFVDPFLSGAVSGGRSGDVLAGVLMSMFGIAMLIPCVLSLVGGRKSWVHTLATVVVILSMLTTCCLPIGIPMLIFWMRPETKRWYGAS